MRLASEEISVEIAGETAVLVPSLRAAMRLVRKHSSFTTLAQGVLQGRLEVMTDIVREGTGSSSSAKYFGFDVQHKGLCQVLAAVQVPMLEFVANLCAFDPDAQPSGEIEKPVAPELFLESLFRSGTGWLGWTPEATLNATPTEIIAAKQGRVELMGEMLKAVFGEAEEERSGISPEQAAENVAAGLDPDFDRAGLQALKSKAKAWT